jgi:hypothetical protein
MKPATRQQLLTLAFHPFARVTDRRAEWYLRHLDNITRSPEQPAPPRPRWHIILELVAVWSLVATAALWLAYRYGWIA